MTKAEFEDLLSRAGELAKDWNFFLIGSQALRGVCATIPRDFPKTIEADRYLDCTDPGLATLPDGWTERLIPFRTPRTGGVTAWCLAPHDRFVSKLVAWREKGQQFLRAMLKHKLARPKLVANRIEDLPVSSADQAELKMHAEELVAQLRAISRKSLRRSKS